MSVHGGRYVIIINFDGDVSDLEKSPVADSGNADIFMLYCLHGITASSKVRPFPGETAKSRSGERQEGAV